jgi:hypothetical protein
MKRYTAEIILTACLSVAAGCCPPDAIEAKVFRASGNCQMDINYEGTALGVYVAETTAKFPRSQSKFEGIVFFGLDTTTFPDGIVPPVRYGETDKERAVDTELGYQRSDDAMYNVILDEAGMPTGENKYELEYPMPLENIKGDCAKCELSSRDPLRKIGPFKIGIVTVPGNTELELPGEDGEEFICPAPGEAAKIFGTELAPHYGV